MTDYDVTSAVENTLSGSDVNAPAIDSITSTRAFHRRYEDHYEHNDEEPCYFLCTLLCGYGSMRSRTVRCAREMIATIVIVGTCLLTIALFGIVFLTTVGRTMTDDERMSYSLVLASIMSVFIVLMCCMCIASTIERAVEPKEAALDSSSSAQELNNAPEPPEHWNRLTDVGYSTSVSPTRSCNALAFLQQNSKKALVTGDQVAASRLDGRRNAVCFSSYAPCDASECRSTAAPAHVRWNDQACRV